jgi:hypothetical protein
MSLRSLGMDLESSDKVRLWVSRSQGWACFVIEADETHCEIRMKRLHVEALRDFLPEVLAGLDRSTVQDSACEKAEIAGGRATGLAAQALDRAVAAEAAGAFELATSLRAVVAEATEKANAVDAAVRAFDDAAGDADCVAERLIYAIREAEKALGQLRGDERPAELATP